MSTFIPEYYQDISVPLLRLVRKRISDIIIIIFIGRLDVTHSRQTNIKEMTHAVAHTRVLNG